MLQRILIALIAVFTLVLAGCKPAEEAPANGESPEASKMADTGATGTSDSKDPEAKPAENVDNKGGEAQNAALAKCQGCQMEVPKAELASHDGMMLCKQCIASHNH
jgi:formylmethanofuran dehydrogenase subunit E